MTLKTGNWGGKSAGYGYGDDDGLGKNNDSTMACISHPARVHPMR
jgi:hypothetical protein